MIARIFFCQWQWAIRTLLGAVIVFMPAIGVADVDTDPEGHVPHCERTINADVVALDQVFFYNRIGAVNPYGMIYALRRDVVDINSGLGEAQGGTLLPGQVMLRPDKRPRPLVLRANVGDCVQIQFQNLLAPARIDANQPATRAVSIHVAGTHLVNDILDDGSFVGQNPNSLVLPGQSHLYTYHAARENTYLISSMGATTGGEGDGGTLAHGLFGALNVQPRGAEYYRSQITNAEMIMAADANGNGVLDPSEMTPDGHPLINYDAVYPAGHASAGLPIINMMNGTELVHSDINAIITGPNRGDHLPGTYSENFVIAPRPDRPREEPFREFTIVFHDEIKAVQAFEQLYKDPVLGHTLHSVRDGFAINYGTGGIGSEILANRFGVGPMWDCVECKYEEFFLTSWAVGDPAMVVDIPANVEGGGALVTGPKASVAFYPDDPSNVHHSYIGDHTKFRNLHAGPKEHHIFHLHAHQWLFAPESDNSAYDDSQAVGPGSGYTYEITFNGAGNRNQTVGDAIFHCHFYPHFAQGMWSLWRNHDVFEFGTELLADGRPAPGSRALPDGEIADGTPIPALVPVPGNVMPPMPGPVHIEQGQIVIDDPNQNPGYPFYIAGVAGHRPPHPPLDTVDDGGLPRHIIVGGDAHFPPLNRLDFSKELDQGLVGVDAIEVPEEGTDVEKTAMEFHAQRLHASYRPDGSPASFVTNGLGPKPGAPFADPCIDDFGNAMGRSREYKGAAIQLDIAFNKVGWHFPQSRILTLWEDVAPTKNGQRPPEPFFFRANTNDCLTFYHTNLVPNVYHMDDFQVETPTDIIGQHIHLVKFDVTSSDGGGNGWNYEDGTFSPDEVIERINAINAAGGLFSLGGGQTLLTPEPHPFFGTLGAQTTVQRWFADDVINKIGQDRTLRTVFTHDHFGPSTHQQAGLYASLVIEPEGSFWKHPENGQFYGTRSDGGPTSWKADIISGVGNDGGYREFMFQFADFQLAYEQGLGPDPALGECPLLSTTGKLPAGVAGPLSRDCSNPTAVVNPPGKVEDGLPFLVAYPDVAGCPGSTPGNIIPAPCPEAISADDVGTFTVNYRNEPVALRVRDPATNTQAPGLAGDLSHVYRSDIQRADPALNVQPGFYPPLTGGVQPGDPFTPLLRMYQNDTVQIRVQVGATEEGHNMTIHGVKWLQEISWPDSGYRNSQLMGISEHFEFQAPLLESPREAGPFADYLYKQDSSSDGQWNGLWGLMRAYNTMQPDLQPLPDNPVSGPRAFEITNLSEFNGVCPRTATVRRYDVSAVRARTALPDGTLIYNSRTTTVPSITFVDEAGNLVVTDEIQGPLHDPTALLYVLSSDLNADGTLKPGIPVEPLVLRANAGECIEVTLRNRLISPLRGDVALTDLDGWDTLPTIIENFNANQVVPSTHVGLHPQLVAVDVTRHDGTNVGLNEKNAQGQTAKPGRFVTYRWYAGDLTLDANHRLVATPVEFGATNLMPSDPIKHASKGLIGALIIEPRNSVWVEDAGSRASATVFKPDGSSFREFVLLFQDNVNLRDANMLPIASTAEAEDPEDSGQKAFNYKTEPMWFRKLFPPDFPLGATNDLNMADAFSNSLVGGDPETPVFTASVGEAVRFRILQPGGHPRNHVFTLHGHVWERMPYINNSTEIGNNVFSPWIESQEGHGPSNHFDVLLKRNAGGGLGIPGDYLYRDQASFQTDGGLWGIMRVEP